MADQMGGGVKLNLDAHQNTQSQFQSQSQSSSAAMVTLSWKDLWVTVQSSSAPPGSNGGRVVKRHLLHGLNGYAEPGHIMAIMGPSGSGKSTLLDTLSGIYIHTFHRLHSLRESLIF